MSRLLRDHVVPGQKRNRMRNGRLFRVRRGWSRVRGHRLLCHSKVRIVGIEPARDAEQGLDMGESRRWIGLGKRCDQQPVGPGLCHNRVRLGLIKQVRPLLIQLSRLFR